ncbi:MAG: tetratricopeptide repeat protein [Bacteroidota bacterium]
MIFFKTSYFHTYLFLLFALINSQCSNSKKISTSKSTKLSNIEELKFSNFFIDGCKERMRDNFENAEKLFLECYKIDPNSAALNYELAILKKYQSQNDQALKFIKVAASKDPKNEWYQLLFIECLNSSKQYSEAIEEYIKLLKIFPNRIEFYEGLASEYIYVKNFEKALKIYEELGTKFGPNETLFFNKIRVLKTLNKITEAEEELKNLILLNPSEIKYYSYLAEFYQEIKQGKKAFQVYVDALKLDPNNPMIHLALADYYKGLNDKENFYKEIKIAFENPDLDIETKYKILTSYYKLSEEIPSYEKEGKELCEIILRVHPKSSEAHSIKGDFLLKENKKLEALAEYETAVQLNKDKSINWNKLMFLQAKLNENKKLETSSDEAMELYPNQPFAFFFNGVANIQLQNYRKAIESLITGIEFVYDDKALLLKFYYNLGTSYHYLKEYDKSDKSFDNALKINPDNHEVLNNYAYYLSERKINLDKAEKYSRRSNELSPNNRSYIDTYGWILYQLGKYNEAEVWLSRAVKLGNKDTVILEHFGDLLFKLNRTQEAISYWQEAKLNGNGSEFLERKLADKKMYE